MSREKARRLLRALLSCSRQTRAHPTTRARAHTGRRWSAQHARHLLVVPARLTLRRPNRNDMFSCRRGSGRSRRRRRRRRHAFDGRSPPQLESQHGGTRGGTSRLVRLFRERSAAFERWRAGARRRLDRRRASASASAHAPRGSRLELSFVVYLSQNTYVCVRAALLMSACVRVKEGTGRAAPCVCACVIHLRA